ncbi:MAG: sulfurtransferase [Renibacterium salmoninarum]|nr:sulfurtransferase [Renibacterium salmoninarum]
MAKTLIDVAEVRQRAESGQRTVLLDVRWALGDPNGREHYLESHIPGAVYVSLATELAGAGLPQEGRHPLPSIADFQASARRWGINDADLVVGYDDSGNLAAARLWWLLRHAGFESVRLLDGGLAAWRAAGLPTEAGEIRNPPGTVSLEFGWMPVVSLEQVAGWSEHGVLLDARAGERYRGETEPVDPRAGHIPGARSRPTAENLDAAQKFRPAAELAADFAALGAVPGAEVAAYCGSGVTAAHQVAALEIAGIRAALFPGSWSAWSQHPELPVATG